MDRNRSLNSTSKTCNYRITSQDITFCVLYSTIVIVGVVGNCMVITVIRKNRSMHNAMNYLLLNMSAADLVTLLFCPGVYDFSLLCADRMPLNAAGDLICKLFVGNAIVPITINVAVLTVCTIAVERYLALVRPLRTSHFEAKVQYIIGVIWLVAILSCIPDILTNTYQDDPSSGYVCARPWSLEEQARNRAFIASTCVLFGFVPVILLTFCYFQIVRGLFCTRTICSEMAAATQEERESKRKLARLSIYLTALFALCSLPFSLFFLCLLFLDAQHIQEQRETLYLSHRIVRFFLFSNSCLNPILYTFQSSNYREGFASLCCHRNEARSQQTEMGNGMRTRTINRRTLTVPQL